MFYELVEKDGVRKGVYSQGDLKYLEDRGWKLVKLERNEEKRDYSNQPPLPKKLEVPSVLDIKTDPFEAQKAPRLPVEIKRKRGRPRKVY